MEEKFYELLLQKLGIPDLDHMRPHTDRHLWPDQRRTFEAMFKSKTRKEWCDILEGTDVCFAPVLTMEEAPEHPHIKARRTYLEIGGIVPARPSASP